MCRGHTVIPLDPLWLNHLIKFVIWFTCYRSSVYVYECVFVCVWVCMVFLNEGINESLQTILPYERTHQFSRQRCPPATVCPSVCTEVTSASHLAVSLTVATPAEVSCPLCDSERHVWLPSLPSVSNNNLVWLLSGAREGTWVTQQNVTAVGTNINI